MCRTTIRTMFGGRPFGVIIRRSIIPASGSASAAASTSASVSAAGEAGDFGDGAPTGSAAQCLLIIRSSLALDFSTVSGRVFQGERSGRMIRFIASAFHMGTRR
jgi:hypothetical protein